MKALPLLGFLVLFFARGGGGGGFHGGMEGGGFREVAIEADSFREEAPRMD